MNLKLVISAVATALFATACQSLPSDMRVADYCRDASKANESICQVSLELDGTKRSLSETNLSVSEARTLAQQAVSLSQQAKEDARSARSMASAALAREAQLACETRTIQKSDTGTCGPDQTLMSCTQTRYTTRAGGLSFLREINNKSCRFNSRVLEMQVKCCSAQAAPLPTQQYSTATN